MTNKLGSYWSVMHRRPQDYAFFQKQQSSVLLLMDGGDNDYQWIKDNLPNSLVLARIHSMSEQHSEMLADPEGTGRRHAQQWYHEQERLGFDRTKTLVLGINEPQVWEAGVTEALRRYTIALCDHAASLGLRVGAMQFGVGWPNNTGPGTPPDWSPWHGVEDAIRRGNHMLVTHEYWADAGPSENWGWWGGRTLKCPWQVPFVIGECGVDMFVKSPSFEGTRGWNSHKTPEQYAAELGEYVKRMSTDSRFEGACIFTCDFASHDWWSFDVEPAYNAILSLPIPSQPPTPTPSTTLLWPCKGPVTQRFGENYALYLEKYGYAGHNGTDIGAPQGTPILAPADGAVAWADTDPDYGNYVRIYHPHFELHSFFAHLQEAKTRRGDMVHRGQIIGVSGSTGNSTGPHLHFEIRLGGGPNSYAAAAYGHTKGRVDPETIYYTLGEG